MFVEIRKSDLVLTEDVYLSALQHEELRISSHEASGYAKVLLSLATLEGFSFSKKGCWNGTSITFSCFLSKFSIFNVYELILFCASRKANSKNMFGSDVAVLGRMLETIIFSWPSAA